jgi:hypothetical protein
VYFRSVPGLVEGDIFDIEQLMVTAEAIGVTFDR